MNMSKTQLQERVGGEREGSLERGLGIKAMVEDGTRHDPREDLGIETKKRFLRDKPTMVENSAEFQHLVVPGSRYLKDHALMKNSLEQDNMFKHALAQTSSLERPEGTKLPDGLYRTAD